MSDQDDNVIELFPTETSNPEPKPADNSQTQQPNPDTPDVPVMSYWDITFTDDEHTNMVFYDENNNPICIVPYDEKHLTPFYNAYNSLYKPDDVIPDEYTFITPKGYVKDPQGNLVKPDPLLTFTKRKRILSTISLTQKELKALIKTLQKKVINPKSLNVRYYTWGKNHPKTQKLLNYFVFPLITISIIAWVLWNLKH